ncbi:MAG: DUF4236 domain-containing protein [bacterium]
MALRFRKSVNLGSGTKLNIGKGSVGISGGISGVRVSTNSRGQSAISGGVPGSGVSYRKTYSSKQGGRSVAGSGSGSWLSTAGIVIAIIVVCSLISAACSAIPFLWVPTAVVGLCYGLIKSAHTEKYRKLALIVSSIVFVLSLAVFITMNITGKLSGFMYVG